jgi:RND family efflux transporter MFP subunit
MLRTPQLATAKAKVTIAQSNVNLAETNLQRTKVISNADYVVLSKTIYHGSFVNKGDNLAELAQLTTLRVSLAVPSHIAAMLKVNQVVEVSANKYKKHQALISHISPSLYANSQLQQVYLSIENAERAFILGEFISASLALTKQKNTLKVPLSAIDNGNLWLVNQHNRLSTKPAEIIWQDEGNAIVHNTIAKGESIIISKVSGAQVGMIANIVSGVL